MVMQAQPTQGMSISDILKIAQMARENKQAEQPQPTGDVPSQVEHTYTRESGAPALNGSVPPVPPPKPDFNSQETQGSGNTLSSILDKLKSSTLGGWLISGLGG